MGQLSRRGMLRNIMLLAGIAAIPHGKANALFSGPQSLPAPTLTLFAAVADTIVPETDTPGASGAASATLRRAWTPTISPLTSPPTFSPTT